MKQKYLFFTIWRGYWVDSWLMNFPIGQTHHSLYIEGKIWKEL